LSFKGQYIGRFLTFLAGLIILTHAVVPHHHHLEISHSSEERSNCKNTSNDKNTESADYHCHAFNVLVSNGTAKFSLNQSSSAQFSFLIPLITSNIEFFPVQNITSKFLDYKAIFLKQLFVPAHALRGPPLFA